MGARRPSAPMPQPCPLSQFGRSATMPRRTAGPKRASGSCILQRETLLGQPTTAPTRLGSRKQRKSFSPPEPALHRANRGWAAPAPWALLLCWVSPVSETHSPRVLLRGEAGFAARTLLRPGPSHAPRASSATQRRGPVATTAPTNLLAAAFCKGKLSSGSKPQPQRTSDGERTQAVFAPGYPLSLGRTGAGLPRLPGPCCFAGGLRRKTLTPHGFSFVGKQD